MPFGLCNAPATFQRLINTLFGDLNDQVIGYLDDLIVFSRDVPSHIKTLNVVLQRLQEAGLKLKLTKCHFLQQEIKFLGHTINREGIHTQSDKIEAVLNFPQPKTAKNIKSFLGLCSYYRNFVQHFSTIAKPLNNLLKKNAPFVWGPDQQRSFETLKNKLVTAPVLSYPNFSIPFQLYTDASSVGLGAVLMQEKSNGMKNVISYASRALNPQETRYAVTEQETLAIVWALKAFREIILGYPLQVYTDHQPVLGFFKGQNLSGKLARWYLTIMEFQPHIEINYIPGRVNHVADCLSRHPVGAISKTPINFDSNAVMEHQQKDATTQAIIHYLNSGDKYDGPKLTVPLNSFALHDGILYRKLRNRSVKTNQVVIPQSMILSVLTLYHNTAGHPGRDRCLSSLREKYYWPKMKQDTADHIRHCQTCNENKGHTTGPAPLQEYPTPNAPFETIAIDLLALPQSHQGSKYLLTVVDHFSRFLVGIPLKTKSADEVAHKLITKFICPYTCPLIIISDNGTEFKNQILQKISEFYGIKRTFITPYHPAANGLNERANQKILQVLRTTVSKMPTAWEDWIDMAIATINGIKTEMVGKSPHEIIYGVPKRLPYDVLVNDIKPCYNMDDYTQRQKLAFENTHNDVHRMLEVSRKSMKAKQLKIAKPSNITLNDEVMLQVPDRTPKLLPRFTGPYTVISIIGNKIVIRNNATNVDELVHVDRLKKLGKRAQINEHHKPVTRSHKQITPPSNLVPTADIDVNYRQKLRSANKVL
jgi:transposase InsO family protein